MLKVHRHTKIEVSMSTASRVIAQTHRQTDTHTHIDTHTHTHDESITSTANAGGKHKQRSNNTIPQNHTFEACTIFKHNSTSDLFKAKL